MRFWIARSCTRSAAPISDAIERSSTSRIRVSTDCVAARFFAMRSAAASRTILSASISAIASSSAISPSISSASATSSSSG
ncbi:hypothetical protein [Microbacterium sp. 10M-3C3]|uniref:hypothetical protein n=1 Tax=Microbacterium sp. 10M-3C3 TaxID=2483401 RepID=UPI0013DE2664|nr:hypothetical protein [Microbacterium sp. 10M-3C3]